MVELHISLDLVITQSRIFLDSSSLKLKTLTFQSESNADQRNLPGCTALKTDLKIQQLRPQFRIQPKRLSKVILYQSLSIMMKSTFISMMNA